MKQYFIHKISLVCLIVLSGASSTAMALDGVEFCVPGPQVLAGDGSKSLCDSLFSRGGTSVDTKTEAGVFTQRDGLLCLYSNHEVVKSLICGATTVRLLDEDIEKWDRNPWIKTRQLFAGTGRLIGKYDFKTIQPGNGTELEKASQILREQAAQLNMVQKHLDGKLENYRDSHLRPAIDENLIFSQNFGIRMREEYLPVLDQVQVLGSPAPCQLALDLNQTISIPSTGVLRLQEVVDNRSLSRLVRWKSLKEALLLIKDETRLTPSDLRILSRINGIYLDQNGILAHEFLQTENLTALARGVSQKLTVPLNQSVGFAIRCHLNQILATLSDPQSLEDQEKFLGSLGLILSGLNAYEGGDQKSFLRLISAGIQNQGFGSGDIKNENIFFEMLTGHSLNADFTGDGIYSIRGIEDLTRITSSLPFYFRIGQKRLSSSFVKGCVLFRNLDLAREMVPVFLDHPDLVVDAVTWIWEQFEFIPIPENGIPGLKQQITQSVRDFVRTH